MSVASRPGRRMVPWSGPTPAAVAAALSLALVGACQSEPPAAPTGSAAPSTTPAEATLPADYAETVASRQLADLDLPTQRAFAGRRAQLRGPHFNYLLTASATIRQLTADQASSLDVLRAAEAAPGHELVIAEAGAAGELDEANGGVDGSVDTMEIVIGNRVRQAPVTSPDDLRGLLVISVPVGVHPLLRVIDAGRPQSIDLVTGRRGRDAVAGYYPLREDTAAPDEQQIWVRLSGRGAAGLSANGRLAAVNLGRVAASLQPYVPGRGWARRQRAWLVLRPSITYFRASAAGTSAGPDRVEIDPASFTVTGSDGTRYPFSGRAIGAGAIAGPVGAPPGQAGDGLLVADVPASLRALTVSFDLRGSFRLPKGPVSWILYQGGTQSVRLTPK